MPDQPITRRSFLTSAAATAATAVAASASPLPFKPTSMPPKSRNKLPRWRGFNLTWMHSMRREGRSTAEHRALYEEQQIEWIREWGFDHVRFGTSYWDLIDPGLMLGGNSGPIVKTSDVNKVDPRRLDLLAEGIDLLLKHDLHVDLCMFRLPGGSNGLRDWEPYDMWQADERRDEDVRFWWRTLAERFAHVPAERMTFNILNELPSHHEVGHMKMRDTMLAATEAIREVTPDRTVLIDGSGSGMRLMDNMLYDPVCHSLHAYQPKAISHSPTHAGDWVGKPLSWPMHDPQGRIIDGRERLELCLSEWTSPIALARGVHCGEAGAHPDTPASAFLPWMTDMLDILTQHQIGYAMWQLVGGFGVLDTGRKGMKKVPWHGHELDIELLELLQSH